MILACHQPHYLAWPGYYDKIARCDAFVYLDQVQFARREYQNRNRIKAADGELWLAVPVLSKGRRDQELREVEIDATKPWASEHLKALRLSYGKAPYFKGHEAWLEGLYSRPWTHLMPLCLELDAWTRDQLGIRTPVRMESELGSDGASTARLISLCRRLKADAYLSGAGARAYLDEEAFRKAGIRLLWQDFSPPVYPQRFGAFVPGLATADLLFNVGALEAKRLLRIR